VDATPGEQPARARLAEFVTARQAAAQAALERAMPGDQPDYYAGLLGGMVFGRRAAGPVDNATGDLFRRTGAVHLLVVSGGKITFIISLLVLLIGWRGRRALQPWHLLLIFPPILAFALFAGIAASVVRGLVMAALLAVALVSHRDYDSFSAAALAALAMMLADTNAVFDVGTQLTFAGSLGVICFLPRARLDEATGRKVRPFLPARVFWASVGAWALTTPIIVSTFHGMPLLGNLANVWAVPLMMLILPVGMLALLTGTWLLPVTIALCGVGRELIVALLTGMRLCAALPGAYADLIYFGPWLTLGWYVVVAGGLLLVARRDLRERLIAGWRVSPRDRLFAVVGGLAAVALLTAVWPLAQPRWLRVTVVAVGEGNCFLVQAPDGHALMMDAGTSPDAMGDYLASDTLIPLLARRGVRRLDYFLLSHGDSDHCNALVSLLPRLPLAHFLDPQVGGAGIYRQTVAEVGQRRIPITQARAGVTMDLGDGVTAQVVEPEEPLLPGTGAVENDNSAAALVRYGTTGILLTGDQQEAGIARLTDWARQYAAVGQVQVVLIPHHGRSAQWCGDLLRWTHPQWALVSGSRGPAARQELGDLAPVLSTGEVGAIEVDSDGREVRVGKAR
jgi:competence protein ComEC